jgi:SCP-2 sterol transfer family
VDSQPEPDPVAAFFAELDRRGHDPLLDRVNSTGRFEIRDADRTEEWLVSVKGGYLTATRGGGDADWVMGGERADFVRVIRGDTSALAAFVRGTLHLTMIDPSQRFGLLTRLFAGEPESRKVSR